MCRHTPSTVRFCAHRIQCLILAKACSIASKPRDNCGATCAPAAVSVTWRFSRRNKGMPSRSSSSWRVRRSRIVETRSSSEGPKRSSSTAGPSIQPGGILDVAQPMDVSKVMLVCPKCDRPTRIKHSTLADGKRIRVCGHCGSPLEVKA